MIQTVKSGVTYLLDALDNFSQGVMNRTFDYGPVLSWSSSKTNAQKVRLHPYIEACVVLVGLCLLAVHSRMAQYGVMVESIEDYFLPGLINVSTTNDSGHYLRIAKVWLDKINAGERVSEVRADELMGYLIARLSITFNTSLMTAANNLLYASVALTATSGYALLVSLKQNTLGIIFGVSLIYFFPVYSRTSLGMVDTDCLNLFFLLTIVLLFKKSTEREDWLGFSTLIVLSGVFNYAFSLWYAKPGMFIVLMVALVLTMVAYRQKWSRMGLAVLIFTAFTPVETLLGATNNIISIANMYLPFLRDSEELSLASGVNLRGVFFSTIGEIQPINRAIIDNDYGSVYVFTLALIGTLLWFLQDWRRVAIFFPFIGFIYLYFYAGQRFSFYVAPLLIIGFFVGVGVLALGPIISLVRRLFEQTRINVSKPLYSNNSSGGLPNLLQDNAQSQSSTKALGWSRVFLVPILLGVSWASGFLTPLGTTPPPIIPARELNPLIENVKRYPRDFILVSWWDYGYEITYQTGFKSLTDGSDAAKFANLYIARALVATNALYSADEFRFAAYFDEGILAAAYPKRPSLERAVNTSKDILIYLPSDLNQRMSAIRAIVEKIMPKSAFENYKEEHSTFFVLYNHAPQKYGPFELVFAQADGARLYRLPAPTRLPN